MEQGKNNKGVIALLVVIIVILLALVILLATGIISFKSNKMENANQITNNNDIISQDNTSLVIDDDLIESKIKRSLIEKIGKDDKLGLSVDNSIFAEGHKTLRTEFKDNMIYSYVLAYIATYVKENGTYKNTSGTAGPFVIIFDKNYEFISYNRPISGIGYVESLREIFPTDLIDQAIGVSYGTDEYYQNQVNSYLN